MRFGKVPGKIFWFLVDGLIDEGKNGWSRCEVEREEKKKLVKGVLFDFFHIFFWIERNDDDNFFSSSSVLHFFFFFFFFSAL